MSEQWLEEAVKLALTRFKCPGCEGKKLVMDSVSLQCGIEEWDAPVSEVCPRCSGEGTIQPVQDVAKDFTTGRYRANYYYSCKDIDLYTEYGRSTIQAGHLVSWGLGDEPLDGLIFLPFALTERGNLQIDEMIEEILAHIAINYKNVEIDMILHEDISSRLQPATPYILSRLKTYINLCKQVYGDTVE